MILYFSLQVLEDGPSISVRKTYMQHCYSGRYMKRVEHHHCEIRSATKIQAYIRRTIGRLRYTRGMWMIHLVDFSTPKSRDSAITLQGLYRGYQMRKLLAKLKTMAKKKKSMVHKKNRSSSTGGGLQGLTKKETSLVLSNLKSHSANDKKRDKLKSFNKHEKRRRRSCFMMDMSGVDSLQDKLKQLNTMGSENGREIVHKLRKTM